MACIRPYQGKLVVDWRDDLGKRHREVVKDREAGKKRLGQILRSGEKASSKKTFKQYADWWLENVAKGNIADSTYQEYEAVLRNHVYPKFGDKLFSKITKPMMRELYEAATVRNILAPVRGMYNQAIEDGEPIPLNPAARFGKKNRGEQKTKINPYTTQKKKLLFFSKKPCNSRRRNMRFILLLCEQG